MILRTGDYLQSRYEILQLIGSGGMSEVYRAHCHKLNRAVAIKVLKKEYCSDEEFVRKFKMEAQAAASLNHPNIVNVFDVVDEEELHYIVMELVEGITLKNYIQKKGKLSVKAAADAANPDFTIDAELLEDGMLKMTLVASDSPMNLYFVPAEPAATGEG